MTTRLKTTPRSRNAFREGLLGSRTRLVRQGKQEIEERAS